MYLFILGVVFGMGLHAAIRSVLKTMQLRKINKAHAVEIEVQRRVDERLNPMGWDSIPPPPRFTPGSNRPFVPMRHP